MESEEPHELFLVMTRRFRYLDISSYFGPFQITSSHHNGIFPCHVAVPAAVFQNR